MESQDEEDTSEVESTEDTSAIKIDVPRPPEVNPEIYYDVESLLFRGFLTMPGEINKVSFVFKSLNHHEFDLLQFITGIRKEQETKERFYNLFLAYGVFMINGENVLPDRKDMIPRLSEVFSQFPMATKNKMVRYLSEVNERAMKAIQMVEAYAIDTSSRYRWAQLRGLDLMSSTVTGIAGTERLGMNWGQLIWRALNYYEDSREQAEINWDNSKFIGSCMAGKGIQKIYSQDKDRRRKEQEEKIERRDKIIRKVRFGQEFKDEQEGRVTRVYARTLEELTNQLQSDLRGEKDWHDTVIEAEERRLKEAARNRQAELQKLMEEREQQYKAQPIQVHTKLEGLTDKQLQQRLSRQRQEEAQRLHGKVIYPDQQENKLMEFYGKYGDPSESTYQSGIKTTVTQTDRDTGEVHSVDPTRPTGKPFRR